MPPWRLTRPFNPTIPQYDAGSRIEPPVSEPIEPYPIPAATATAEPLLDPDDDRAKSQGFGVAP
jgi:hypothetical protein